jgi:hypothetical protein
MSTYTAPQLSPIARLGAKSFAAMMAITSSQTRMRLSMPLRLRFERLRRR